MKLRSLFLLVIAAVLAVASPRPAQALEVSFSFFQDSLAPYGEWLEVGDYGYCWRPAGVDEDWAPYADGYWAFTDGGWTWVSYEDFGGIVYHYGRWVRVEDEGWVWTPGYEWAPAWVSWRNNDNYVGWAPLPPEAHWRRDRGFSSWVDVSFDISPSCYNVVRTVDFGAPFLRPLLGHRRDNVVFIQNTVNITNITYNTDAGCVFNGGPDYRWINRHAQRPIPALKLVQNTNITVVNNTIINNNVRVENVNPVQQGNQLVVVAPNVIRPDAAKLTALVKPNVRRVVPQARVTKGWATMPAGEQTAIRTKFKQETKDLTPETAPARPMKVADIEAVPKTADPDAPSPAAIRKDRPRPGVPTRDKVTADREPATVPATAQPTAAEKPANPRDAAKITREKAGQLKTKPDGKPADVATLPPANPPASTEQPGATEKPADPRETAKITREMGPAQKATPEPKAAEVATSPALTAPAVPGRVKPARPEVMKPFTPATTAEQPATERTPAVIEAPVKRTAAQQNAEGRERAAAATREQAAEQQQAIRQRQAAQDAQDAAKERATAQQQQEIIRKRQNDAQAEDAMRKRSAEATQERQKIIQQQQEQSSARARAAEQQDAMRQRQAAQQSQEAARERAAQVAAQRERAVASQQQQQDAQARAAQAAAARERGAQQQMQAARQEAAERSQAQAARQQASQQQQAQAAAREQAMARAQAQNAARQQVAPPQQRQVAPPQRQVAPQQQQRTVPGKRQLTPEEIEALKRQR